MDKPYRPTLPPVPGYVEVDGQYVKIEGERDKLDDYTEFIAGMMEGYLNEK